MRAYTHRFISFAIQCAVIIALALSLSFSAEHSLAQDVATDTPAPSESATIAPTVVPTEQPAIAPTEEPTQEATAAPPEATTGQPTAAPTDTTVTAAPTEAVTQPPTTPDTSDVFTETFQDGETSGWLLTAGWTLSDEAGNALLTASTPNEIATLTAITWPYFTLTLRVRGSIQVNMASGGSNYLVKVAADGAAALYKDGALLGEAAGAVPTEATVEPGANWHTLNLLAPGNLLAIKVDNFTPISTSDATLVGMGPIMFSTAGDNTTNTAFDDLSMQRLDDPPPLPTAVPTASGVVPIPPPMNVTAEPTVELTAEATIEATQEATAEATAEATTEATAEATSEATPEATAEPRGLSEAGRVKLSQALADMLDSYLAGDTAGAQASALDNFIMTDQQDRISIIIWATGEDGANNLASIITDAGDSVTEVFSIRVKADVSLETLLTLANSDDAGKIEVPPKATSTSNLEAPAPVGQGTGAEITEGVDATGASAWHNAAVPVKGSNVKIGVIDTGFGTAAVGVSGEYACLFQSTLRQGSFVGGDTSHGLAVVQILCDMAPAAKVYMYKATDASSLAAAVLAAKNDGMKVIVITMDLGASVSPGNGSGGGALYGIDDVYTKINEARGAGIIVVASAGNNSGRYVTLNYTSTSTTVPMTVYGGDTIHTSWNDWSSTSQNVAMTVTGAGYSNPSFNAGGARSGPPRAFATVPAGTCLTGCDVDLNISGSTSGIVLQVQVAGQGTINAANVSPNIVVSTAGNIARPADSQDVIAVGAVCNADYILQPSFSGAPGTIGLVRDSNSSVGPVFGSGGALSSVVGPTYTRDQVKPDLMTLPSSVSIAGSTINSQFCNQVDGDGNPIGFSGTSSSAAHLAGMAALLVSNTTNTSMSAFAGATGTAVDAIQNYLQTHAVDNTSVAANAVGYDMSYGAGTSVLGSPTYNLNLVSNPTTATDQLPAACSSGALYVGLANPGAAVQDGSITNPYISIAEAMKNASSSQCVVIMPGEYVAPIAAVAGTPTPAVLSYESATTFAAPAATNLWAVIAPPISIFSNDVIVDGFVVQGAKTLGLYYPIASGIAPFVINGGSGAIIQNSNFSGFTVIGSDGYGQVKGSTNVQLKNNIFSGFVVPFTLSGTNNEFTTSKSNTAVLYVQDSTGVLLANNTFQSNSNTVSTLTSNTWLSAIVGIKNSGVNIYNNRFESNNTGALIGINAWSGSPLGGTRQAAEVRMVGNLFNSNTVNGPLVHLFSSQDLRFVNNTVVSNAMNGGSDYDGFFMYGLPDSIYGNMLGSAVEIHNNLFYNNGTVGRGLLQTVNPVGNNVGCASIASGGAAVPVRNNWFSPTIGTSFLPGACTDGDKIQNSLTEPITAATFFGTSADPVNPFRLRPNINAGLIGGINYGDNAALTAIFGSDLSGVKDLLGASRVILSGTSNTSYQTANVDVGAYELAVAAPLEALPGTQTINEDPVGPLVFNLTASGGYIQVFTITSQPTEYDANPNNACGGQPLLFTPPNTVTYCPPVNFHTQYGSGGTTSVPITIGFSVEDPIFNLGQISSSTISLTITPTIDDAPVVQNFTTISDYVTPINYQLTPWYRLDNFQLSSGAGVDFPFTFSYQGQMADAGQNNTLLQECTACPDTATVIQQAITAANTPGPDFGKLILNTVPGSQGFFKFNYRVTDKDGQQSNAVATIVVLPNLATEGSYDDVGFNVAYVGNGWKPLYSATAQNTTLHSTTTSGDYFEFPFTGAVNVVNLISSNTGNTSTNTLNLSFDLDIGNVTQANRTYAQVKSAIPGFSCINSLNGLEPDPTTSNIINYSAVPTAYTLTCTGFNPDQANKLRLKNNNANMLFTLDAVNVASGILKVGSHEETNVNITYTGTGWTSASVAGPSGGSFKFSYYNGAKATFKFNGAGLVLYRTLSPYAGTMQVKIDGSSQNVSNVGSAVTWQQPASFTGLTTDIHTVEITNVGGTGSTGFIDLDRIDVLTAPVTLAVGSYEETNVNITYTGTGWTSASVAGPSGGSFKFSYYNGAKATFKFNGAGLVLYRTLSPYAGTMQVKIDGSSQTVSNVGSAVTWQQPASFTGLVSGVHTVEITNVGGTGSTGFIDLDRIDVLGLPVPLTTNPGTYQENDPNITYTGTGWTTANTTGPANGAFKFSYYAGAKASFKMTGERLVLYRTLSPYAGTMKVTISSGGTPLSGYPQNVSNVGSAVTWQQPAIFSVTSGTYDVTIENLNGTGSNGFVDIDRIDVLGAPVPLTTSPGTYQESDPNISYTGTGWTATATTGPSNGAFKFSYYAGAKASFKMTGERLVLYRTLSPNAGTMKVTISSGGTPVSGYPQNVSNVAASVIWQQPVIFSVTNGTYDVTVENLSGTGSAGFIDIDRIDVLPAIAPLTTVPGSYQESDLNLTYTGAGWTSVTTTGPSNGAFKFSYYDGARVAFKMTGERLVLYRTLSPYAGNMKVTISTGGTPVSGYPQTISNVGSAVTWQQPVTFSVTSGTYDVTIENVGGTGSTGFIDVDRIDVLPAIAPLSTTPGTYEESNPDISYTGTGWTTTNTTGPSNGTFKFSYNAGAKASFKITGQRLVLYRTLSPSAGTMRVTISSGGTPLSGYPQDISNVAAVVTWQQPVIFALTSSGTYDVAIENLNGTGSAGFVDVDRIDVLSAISPLTTTPGSYQDTDLNITYTGTGWTSSTTTGPSNGSFKFSYYAGAKASFKITGERLVLYRTLSPSAGTMRVTISSGGTPLSGYPQDISNVAAAVTWQQPVIFSVTNGTYDVTIENLSGTGSAGFIDLDRIDVLPAIAPLTTTPGSYEESNPDIAYTGTGWTSAATTGPSNGSFKFSYYAGAKASFKMTGARLVLYRTLSPYAGTMRVTISIGGTPLSGYPQDVSNVAAAVTWQQPATFNVTTGTYDVTIENIGGTGSIGFIDLDRIDVLTTPAPLGPGFYEENYKDLIFNGVNSWITANTAGNSGGTARRTITPNATMTFQVSGATAFAVYRTLSTNSAPMEVCVNPGAICTTNSETSATVISQRAITVSGLTSGTTYTVTITNKSATTTQFIDIDAVDIVNTPIALTPGYYQNTNLNLTYSASNWNLDTVGGLSSGQTTVTTTNNATMNFQFTGTGFAVYTYGVPTGANIQICYKVLPSGSDICATNSTVASPVQATVGYATYGLKQGTYQVTVTDVAAPTSSLYIDSVAVFGSPSTTLSAGTYENDNPAFLYAPAPLWFTSASTSFSGGSITASYQKGTIVQFSFTGNTVVLYQAFTASTSNNAALCWILQGNTVNPSPECTTFSQNSSASVYNAPIAFYGFGSGTHDVVIENRQSGGAINVDKVVVK